jgi:hypothetical protein
MKSTVTQLPEGWFVFYVRVAWSGGHIIDGAPDHDEIVVEEERFEVLALEHGPFRAQPEDRALENVPKHLWRASYRLVVCGGDFAQLLLQTTDSFAYEDRQETEVWFTSGPWHDAIRPLDAAKHSRAIESAKKRIDGWIRIDSASSSMLERLVLNGPATEAELLEHPTGFSDDSPWRRHDALQRLRGGSTVIEDAGMFSIAEDKREEVLATFGLPEEPSTNGAAE